MINFPKISIVTPSLNQGQYIEQTILSILDQKYPNLEYIIIDGGSNDNTLDIIKKYEKHLAYWVSEKDSGQSEAINKGLARSTGEIFNWLNSDDYYSAKALHHVSSIFQENNSNVICGSIRNFSDNFSSVGKGTDIFNDNLSKTIGWARIDQPSTFFKKSVIDKIGPLNTSLHYTMDREWWIKYLLLFGLSNIDRTEEILVNFRLHPQSKTISSIPKFEIERDSIFFSLATQFKLKKYLDIINKTCNLDLNYNIVYPKEATKELVEQSMNYFLLLKGEEFYVKNDKKNANICFKGVEYLSSKNDRLHLQFLKFKNKFLPSFLINLLRKKIEYNAEASNLHCNTEL